MTCAEEIWRKRGAYTLLEKQYPMGTRDGRYGRRALLVLLAVLAMLAATMFAVPRTDAKTNHCTDHRTDIKVDADDSPATVEVPDTSNGTIEVIVTITGTDISIEAADSSVDLTDAEWCIKSSTNTNDGTGTTGSSTSSPSACSRLTATVLAECPSGKDASAIAVPQAQQNCELSTIFEPQFRQYTPAPLLV